MATIRREVMIEAPVQQVWDAVRDVGAIHTRLAPGFVTDVQLEGSDRVVTFGNGIVARERIVALDDANRRLVWSVVGGRMSHHNASVEILPHGITRSRFIWTADLLPDDVAPAISAMIDQGLSVIKQTLDR